MIRLFVAIDLPETIRPFVAGMGRSIPGSRPVPEEQLHITLKFIGDTNENQLPEIRESLRSVRFRPLRFQLKDLGHFPPRGKPTVIWAGIKPAKPLISLRNTIERNLEEIGIEREKRKFSPHLTLCRLRNSPIKRVTGFLMDNSGLETPEFEVNSFTLYSSILTPKGAIHTIEETFVSHKP